jgi:hypothetical protein
MSTVCVRLPLVPATRNVKLPMLADEETVMVKVLESYPLEGGVTEFLLNEHITPEGALPIHEALSETCELKPLMEATLIVEAAGAVPEDGRVIERELGLAERLKSGVDGG